MIVKKIRFFTYTALLSCFAFVPYAKARSFFNFLTGNYQTEFGNATYQGRGQKENEYQFDYYIKTHLLPASYVDKEAAIDEDVVEFMRNESSRNVSASTGFWPFTTKKTDNDTAHLLVKFKRVSGKNTAKFVGFVVVDEDNNEIMDKKKVAEIKRRLPFTEDNWKTIRCTLADGYEKIPPNHSTKKRQFRFGHGNVALNTKEDAIRYRNNSLMFFGGLTLTREQAGILNTEVNKKPNDPDKFPEKLQPSVYNPTHLYVKVLRGKGKTDKEIKSLLPDLPINPYSLGLESRMLDYFRREEDVPVILRFAFRSEVNKFLDRYGRGPTGIGQGFRLYQTIYHTNKSFTTIAEKLINNSKSAAEHRAKEEAMRSNRNIWTEWRFLLKMALFASALVGVFLVIYKILGRILDIIVQFLFPEVKLEGVSAYSMETNNLVNLADWIGPSTGKFIRSTLKLFKLWKPKPTFEVGNVFYPTESNKRKVEQYIKDTIEVITYNNQEKRARRVPDNNIKNFVIYGPPGTGKTLITQVIVETLKAKGLIDYMVIKVTDVLGYKYAYQASRLIKLVEKRARIAKRLGKAFCIVLQEMDALGKRYNEDSGVQEVNEVRKTFLQGLVQMFDSVGSPYLFIVATQNSDPANTSVTDRALQDRFDKMYQGYPGKDTLIDIFLYWLGKHGKGDIKIGDKEEVRQFLVKAPYIKNTQELTGRDMDKLSRDTIIRKRQALRKARKGKRGKKKVKGTIFLGDIEPIFNEAYKQYISMYEVDENEEDSSRA